MSYKVENPEDRFSRDDAHIISISGNSQACTLMICKHGLVLSLKLDYWLVCHRQISMR